MADDNKRAAAATTLFQRGSEAVRKGNFDYAVEHFLKCVKLVPEKLMYRQALRGAERKMYKDNGKGASMAGMKLVSVRTKLKIARQRGKWQDVLYRAEQGLKINPWDAGLLYDVADAAAKLEMVDTALWNLELASEIDKENKEIFVLLGEMHIEKKNWDKASWAYERVKKIDPSDDRAHGKQGWIGGQKALHQGGYRETSDDDQDDDAADAIPSAAVKSEAGADGPKIRIKTAEEKLAEEIEQLRAAIAEAPDQPGSYLHLADTLRRNERYDEAAKVYQAALENTSAENHEDLRILKAESELFPLQQKYQELREQLVRFDKNQDDAKTKLRDLKVKYNAYLQEVRKREIALYELRIAKNAGDHESHYEMGTRLFLNEDHTGAIKALQQARNDPRLKWQAMLWLGRTFWAKKNFALADQNLAAALEGCPNGNQEGIKEIHYYRGRVAEDAGDADLAVKSYNHVGLIDYGYRDIESRLERLTS